MARRRRRHGQCKQVSEPEAFPEAGEEEGEDGAVDELVVEHHAPEVMKQPTTGKLPERLRGHEDKFVWPAGKPMPGFYIRRALVPCVAPACRRIRLNDGGQAVVLLATSAREASGSEVAYMRCKECGNQFKLPVKEG